MAKLEKEYNYFLSILATLKQDHNGEYVVIKGNNILGYYDSIDGAIKETSKTHAIGTFLVKRIEDQNENTVMRFHSRVYAAK